MRGPRRPEDLPRLLQALGLADDPVGEGPERDRHSADADERVQAGLDYWLPTAASLAAATRPARGRPPPRPEPAAEGDPRHSARARVLRLPEALVGGRVAVPVRTTIVVLVVAVLALALYGGRVLQARSHDRPAPATSLSTPAEGIVGRVSPAFADGGRTGGLPPGTTGPAPTASGALVVVDVVGQVRHPGVYRLRAGQRVDDAVRAAGGVVSPSDIAAVNLARLVVDGEQIRVPRPGEPSPPPSPLGPTTGGGSGGGLVNLNTASLTDLDGLPGVGPVLAQRILDWRTTHARFTTVDELGEVSGIGEKLLGQLRSRVSVR